MEVISVFLMMIFFFGDYESVWLVVTYASDKYIRLERRLLPEACACI